MIDTALNVTQSTLLIALALTAVFKDTNYEKESALHNKLETLCAAHSSVPEGYDKFDVICKNGVIIQYE